MIFRPNSCYVYEVLQGLVGVIIIRSSKQTERQYSNQFYLNPSLITREEQNLYSAGWGCVSKCYPVDKPSSPCSASDCWTLCACLNVPNCSGIFTIVRSMSTCSSPMKPLRETLEVTP